MKENSKSGLATLGMVLGIIAIVGSWIPFLNVVSIILGFLALIFGAIALIEKKSVDKALTGVVLGILSVIISILVLAAASNAVDEALQPTQTDDASQTETDDSEDVSTNFDGAAVFDQINNGMTKQEVRDIAGIDPLNCTENQSEVLGTTEFCSYGNMLTDDVTISVTYSEGVVSSKTKNTN